jgi:hypothetical protein
LGMGADYLGEEAAIPGGQPEIRVDGFVDVHVECSLMCSPEHSIDIGAGVRCSRRPSA